MVEKVEKVEITSTGAASGVSTSSQPRPAAVSLRESMPNVTAWIDDLRLVFGKELIDRQIRRGLAGEPVFHAWENGIEIGTPFPVRPFLTVDEFLAVKPTPRDCK